MARLPYADEAAQDDHTRDLLEKNEHKNVFRMLAHSPSHLRNFCRMGHAIRFRGVLDPRLRELAIIRTGVVCEAEYEVLAHRRIGAAVGIGPDKLAAVADSPDASVFDSVEQAVLRFTDEVVKQNRPSDAAFETVAALLTPAELVELQLAIGYYVLTSKFLRTFDVDLEPDDDS